MARSQVKGSPNHLNRFRASLRDMSEKAAMHAAKRARAFLTYQAKQSYAAGVNVFDQSRPEGVNGNHLTLIKTTDTIQSFEFGGEGTVVKVKLGTPYAKYLVGKYVILPIFTIPSKWMAALRQFAREGLDWTKEHGGGWHG